MSQCQLCKCFRKLYAERLAFARPAGVDASTLFEERLIAGFPDEDDYDDDYEEDWDEDEDDYINWIDDEEDYEDEFDNEEDDWDDED